MTLKALYHIPLRVLYHIPLRALHKTQLKAPPRVVALLLTGAVALAAAHVRGEPAIDRDIRVFGDAHTEDGTLLYRESHRWDGLQQTVEYHDADGTLIARNQLDYHASRTAPAFRQQNLRRDTVQGARWREQDLLLFTGEREKVVDYSPPLVSSSGFDPFIRGHWQRLAAGEELEFDFAVPTRQTTLRLRVRPVSRGCEAGVALCLRVEAANPVLRWLVQSINLTYDTERQLQTYRGPSNLEDMGLVTIHYRIEPADE